MSKSREQIREIIFKHLEQPLQQRNISRDQVSEVDNLTTIGVLDSLSFLELLTNLEEEFQVEIDFGNMNPEEFTSIESLTTYFHESAQNS